MFFLTGMKNTFCQGTNSGISPDIKENIWIHTDRDFYIAGERVWFRIYLMKESPLSQGGFSRVAYVELLNNSNQSILKQKVKTDLSGGAGYLDIPGDIPTGYYFIRSYTSWMKNFNPAGYFVSAIAVINPASRLHKYTDTTLIQDADVKRDGDLNPESDTGRDSDLKSNVTGKPYGDDVSSGRLQSAPEIIVHNVSQEYKRREKVQFEILTTSVNRKPLSSDISVSVYYSGDKEFDPPAFQEYLSSYSGSNPGSTVSYIQQQDYIFIPEMEGITLSGRIMEPSEQNPVPDVPVILSVVGENAFVQSYLTRADGRFYFNLDDLYGEHDIVLSYGGTENGLVLFIEEPFSRDFGNLPVLELNLDESWRSFIERQLINYQLTSLYTGSDRLSNIDSNNIKRPFYIKPDITIRMEDFIRLPNMEEVFRELVKQVLVTKENGKLMLNVLDINTNRVIGPEPFFILDGVPFFDSGLIFDLNPEDISAINIVCQKYYKGILEMDGIIEIRTNTANLPVSELPGNYSRRSFQGYQSQQKYINPDFSDEQKLKSRIPDFRNLLYWNPSIKTDIEGRVNVSFYTSDNTGTYSISISGISNEGLLRPASYSFKVLK